MLFVRLVSETSPFGLTSARSVRTPAVVHAGGSLKFSESLVASRFGRFKARIGSLNAGKAEPASSTPEAKPRKVARTPEGGWTAPPVLETPTKTRATVLFPATRLTVFSESWTA